ncbi:conserved hypothetical protein [Histoplasma capsulatum var. duboisii H88]|uniref:Uncharacterized protein n=2 Tax=Ajellomyces capsulatus TaxID=5037 RepID=F0USI4_AJEC8|nr:conserved hypothetical protein [Histoplasma capsulatum H143]EGC48861.1 conserved hypothetical protein [Histoplasma capsulatum var. duboisii H88]
MRDQLSKSWAASFQTERRPGPYQGRRMRFRPEGLGDAMSGEYGMSEMIQRANRDVKQRNDIVAQL